MFSNFPMYDTEQVKNRRRMKCDCSLKSLDNNNCFATSSSFSDFNRTNSLPHFSMMRPFNTKLITLLSSSVTSSSSSSSSSLSLSFRTKLSNKSRTSFAFIINCLFVICLILLNYCCTLSEQSLDSFSLDKLLEYNSLASCIGKIHVEFTECNTKGAEKAKSYMTNVEMGSEWSKRIKCCGAWRLRDCWMKAAHEKCNKEQADQIYKLPFLFMPGLDEDCSQYMPESGKCSVPIWLMVGGISTLVFIVVTCCGCVVFCIRRRNSRGRRQRLPTSISGYNRRSVSGSGANGSVRNHHKHLLNNGGAHQHLITGKPCNGGSVTNSLCHPDGTIITTQLGSTTKPTTKKPEVYMNGNSKSTIRQPTVGDATSEECRKLNNGCGTTTTGSSDPTTLSTAPSVVISLPTTTSPTATTAGTNDVALSGPNIFSLWLVCFDKLRNR